VIETVNKWRKNAHAFAVYGLIGESGWVRIFPTAQKEKKVMKNSDS
jgi:hypothetical protein